MATQNAQAQNDPKSQYHGLIEHYNTYSPLAKNVGESILNKLLATSANPATAEINKKIIEAAGRDDSEALIELTNQLKSIKDNEKTHQKSLNELRKNSDWDAIKKAFKPEFEAMAYEAAIEATKAAHAAIQSSKSETKTRKPRTPKAEGESARTPADKKVYQVSGPDNLNIEMIIGQGLKWKEDETIVLEALNIKFTRDNKDRITLEKAQTLKNGAPVTRAALAAALEQKVYEDKGYVATLKK